MTHYSIFLLFLGGKFSLPQLYKPDISPPLVTACHFTLYNLKALQLGSKKHVMCAMVDDERYGEGKGVHQPATV